MGADAALSTQGALVVSLDFELAWGVRDTLDVEGSYRENVLGARAIIPRLLDLFGRYDVAATWATVGFLFADSRDELEALRPVVRPAYRDPRLDPYRQVLGENERDDPLHFAPSLVRQIAECPRQRLGSHTFSHFYALEPGASLDAFEADLAAAVAIAKQRGIRLRSLVFPRNQVTAACLAALPALGFDVVRGPAPNVLNRPGPGRAGALPVRALRLLDTYLPLTGANAASWRSLALHDGVLDVPGSHFLRPWRTHVGSWQERRVIGAMRAAAERGAVFHLWWHPHNMGIEQDENLASLERVLRAFVRLRDERGFESLALEDVADRVRGMAPQPFALDDRVDAVAAPSSSKRP